MTAAVRSSSLRFSAPLRAPACRRQVCVLALLASLACSSHAQVLLVQPGTTDPDALNFNPAFIARNGVQEIQGQPMVKRDNEPMRERKEKHLFRFGTDGRTSYSNHSFGSPGSGRDTASIAYSYEAHDRVIEELHNDLAGHFALTRALDDSGRTTRETYARVENLGTDRYHLVPGRRTEISDEMFRYEAINDTAWKRVFVNSAGLPYREQVWSSDQWGYLRAIHDRWLVTGRMGLITFRYDEKGRLAERIEQSDLSSPATIKHLWRYDIAGNVILCDRWRNDVQLEHREYIYEEGTMFLKATVAKHMDTGLIHIVRYATVGR